MRKQDAIGAADDSSSDIYSPFSATPLTLEKVAYMQGVEPIQDIQDLRADFWPDSDSIDDLACTVRAWRDDGG